MARTDPDRSLTGVSRPAREEAVIFAPMRVSLIPTFDRDGQFLSPTGRRGRQRPPQRRTVSSGVDTGQGRGQATQANNDLLDQRQLSRDVCEAEGVEVRGYPTLIFYPKDNKEGITYEGDRDVESFKAWLNENAPTIKAGTEAVKDDL